jgi:cytochrome c
LNRICKTLLAATVAAPASALAADPAALAEAAKCSVCHMAEAAGVGPSYAAIAERYRGDDTAQETLAVRARAGSTPGAGEWGPVPMPPVPPEQLSDEDLAAVLNWILDR